MEQGFLQTGAHAGRYTCPLLCTCPSESNNMEHPAWQWQEQIHGVELEQKLKLGVQTVELDVELLVLRPGCLMAGKKKHE